MRLSGPLLALALAAVTLPSVVATSPAPPYSSTVEGDARVGSMITLNVTLKAYFGEPARLVASPILHVEDDPDWLVGDVGPQTRSWHLKVVGTGFWRATLQFAPDHPGFSTYCCAVGWSGHDGGDAVPANQAQTYFSSWQVPADLQVSATLVNETYVRVDAAVHSGDARMATADTTLRVHQLDGPSATFFLPERGYSTGVDAYWRVEVPDPADPKAPPVQLGGHLVCTQASLHRQNGTVTLERSPCPVAVGVPGPSFLLAVAGLAVVVVARRRLKLFP
ncbi:MAG TPA: hypothetical protein VM286_09200 [Candidatus Thermoplasmatota archaeon]|nr:hypothetical protein [Candidatus Thermoplasmatota archaeon]